MKVAVVGGGTATNSLVSLFSSVFDHVTYIMPISDNGGSTSEIIRVIGGPAIGDIRSRITRLIPDDSCHNRALKNLFSYRLADIYGDAKNEWNEIVDGTHRLWSGIDSHYKEMIRPFFIHMHVELLKKSRPGREFRFERASIGNLFLSGARLFCGSLDSAVELLCKIADVPNGVSILPVLNTNFSYHISAELENGDIITGQSQISHPAAGVDAAATRLSSATISGGGSGGGGVGGGITTTTTFEDANLPFSHPALSTPQIVFSKSTEQPLSSPIKRIYYINPYGQEIHPRASTRVINSLENSNAIIYSIGSLYTSISPIVILEGFAEQLHKCKHKIMILNGLSDRETTFKQNGMTVSHLTGEQYIEALIHSCIYSMSGPTSAPSNVGVTGITGIATPSIPATSTPAPTLASAPPLAPHPHSHSHLHRNFQISTPNISNINLSLVEPPHLHANHSKTFTPWTNFVTDFIHMTEPDGIQIDVSAIQSHGIKCHHVPHAHGSSNQYDLQSLEQTILRIMG